MATKKGTLAHVKGFILNKLFEKGCISTARSRGKHVPERDLRSGYDPKYHALFGEACDELRNEGLIDRWPARTGRGSESHVAIFKETLPMARPLINAYRRSVGLSPLRRDFKEFTEESERSGTLR